MIAERIARLDEQQRRVLQVASVEGETFTAEVVARVVGIAEGDVVRLLSEALDRAHRLVKAEGVRHLHGQRLSIYRFRHILFQKYLYTTLDAVERSHLHDAVASALQALHGEQTDDVAAELARHFGAAGATDQAADFLKRAGDRAGALVAPGEAAQYYLAAQDAYTKAYGEGWNPMEQVALERKIGEAFFRHGDYQEAAEHLQRALGLLGIRLPESRAQVQRALLGEIVRQAAHRLLPRLSTRPALGAVPGPIQQEMDISYLISFIDFFSSRQERFLLLAFRMLNVAEANGYVPWIARSCAGLTMVFDFMSLRRLARSYSSAGRQPGRAGARSRRHWPRHTTQQPTMHGWRANGTVHWSMASARSPRLAKPERYASERQPHGWWPQPSSAGGCATGPGGRRRVGAHR